MGVVLNKSSQEPPFRKSFASFRGPIRVAFSKIKNSYQESNIWNQTNSNTKIGCCLHEWMEATNMSLWYVASFPLDQYQAWLNAAHFGYMARVDTSFAHLSRAFREPFARNRKKKMSRYYLLSGLSRIFRKPFANVYISRKVPFAQTSQIYACGPRLYKTFHGFLHDSHILHRYLYIYTT